MALRLDSTNSATENDLRFAKGGTDYGAIQTNGSTDEFEFYVKPSVGDWGRRNSSSFHIRCFSIV